MSNGLTVAYRGCCRVPQGYHNPGAPSGNIADTLANGGRGLTYCPTGDGGQGSLFLFGHPYGQKMVELSLPPLVVPTSPEDFGSLHTATVLQAAIDPTAGAWASDGADSAGGLLVVDDTLLASYYKSYDSNQSQTRSHCRRPTLRLDGAPSTGPFQIGPPDAAPLSTGVATNCGFYHGYMGLIPPEWQAAFGGDYFLGQGSTVSILARTSNGPGIFAGRVADIGRTGAPSPRPLVYYPSELGVFDQYNEPPGPHVDNCAVADRKTNRYWTRADQQNAVVMLPGSSTVLVLGCHGIGGYAYGQGTPDKTLDGVPYNETGEVYVYNEAAFSKGPHSASDPATGTTMRATAWVYDAHDLAAVAAGAREPWSVLPTQLITLSLPFTKYNPMQALVGACEADGLLLVAQASTDFAGGSAAVPVIHGFQITAEETAPGPPAGSAIGGAPPAA